MKNLQDWLALALTPGLGPGSCKRLVDHFGDPGQVFEATESDLLRVAGMRRGAARALAGRDKISVYARTEMELETAHRYGVRIVTWDDAEYPAMLRNIHNPPMVLYIKGPAEIFTAAGVGVVGSRAATSYGKEIAGRMSFGLAAKGYSVISGLALGIDTEAHNAALAAGGATIAVLGCGLDVVYPRENRELFRKIPETGALVSEYPFGTKPDGFRFPARNRIISGLALGVLVVEASHRSGSLITAQHALEQGREVFAVPGRVDSIKSAGAHSLLQQGAKLVQAVDDILEELPRASVPQGNVSPMTGIRAGTVLDIRELTPEEEVIVSFLEVYPKNIDEIARGTRLSPQKASEILLLLELKGAVEALPGKCYKRAAG